MYCGERSSQDYKRDRGYTIGSIQSRLNIVLSPSYDLSSVSKDIISARATARITQMTAEKTQFQLQDFPSGLSNLSLLTLKRNMALPVRSGSAWSLPKNQVFSASSSMALSDPST
jgi:hypothetical protein